MSATLHVIHGAAKKANRPCLDCRFYVPDNNWLYRERRWGLMWRPPFIRTWTELGTNAHKYSICTARGGDYARFARLDHNSCGPDGSFWEPNASPQSGEGQ